MALLFTLCEKEEPKKAGKGSFTLPTIDDDTVSLADFKGKVVIIDFWATSCPPCRKAIPHLIKLYNKYKVKGLIILSISIEDKETLIGFRDKNRIPYLILLGSNNIARDYDVQFIPKTIFIDKKGNTRKIQVGFAEELASVFDVFVDSLLSE